MLGSFKIGSVLGITVRVHWLFVALVVFLLAISGGEGDVLQRGDLAIYLALLFGVVFLHELGHSLVARRYGIRIFDITFWPLGGMARMSEIPERPATEMWIAFAGPLVNFVLALLALPLAAWAFLASGDPSAGAGVEAVARWSVTFVGINLMLGTFNLLPAFPMDGGRILRAFLGRSRDWVAATELAVKVGRGLAIAMVLLPLLMSRYTMMLPLIGLFVWFAGARELWAVRVRHGRMPFGPLSGRPIAPDAAAPASWNGRGPDAAARDDGISQAEIERLERFGGSLRQFRAGDGARDA